MILILFILCIIYIKIIKQNLKIFKYTKNNYICNTFITIKNNTKNINLYKNEIKNRLARNNTIDKLVLDNLEFIHILNHKQLLEELYTNNKNLLRILIYNKYDLHIIFQIHRELCGGQERIWNIINCILDRPNINPINKSYEFLNINDFSFNNIINFYKNNILLSNSLMISNQSELLQNSKKIKIKKYNLLKLKQFCLKYNATINDFGITYVIFYLLKSKKFQKRNINIFIPIYFNKEYSYFILQIQNKNYNFIDLLKIVTELTTNTIKNKLIKYHNNIIIKLLQVYPYRIYSHLYKYTIDSVDIFISNIIGFTNETKILDCTISNIYHMYNSYNIGIESGISSYNKQLIISMNINNKYIH